MPDAPWIREAERDGMPPYDEAPDPICPVCGEECEIIYLDKTSEEVGCEHCIRTTDAWEWADEKNEKGE